MLIYYLLIFSYYNTNFFSKYKVYFVLWNGNIVMIYLKYVYLLYTHVASIGIQEINCFQSLILKYMQTMNNYYTIFIRKIKINFKNFDFNIKINLRIINIPQMFFSFLFFYFLFYYFFLKIILHFLYLYFFSIVKFIIFI